MLKTEGASEECQKPQAPLCFKKNGNTPPICIAVPLVPLSSEGREMLSVFFPFVSQYALQSITTFLGT